MSRMSMPQLPERLFAIFRNADFLGLKGVASGVPLFIQPYDPAQEDQIRSIVASLAKRLRHEGHEVSVVDLFELVLGVLQESDLLEALVDNEPFADKGEFLDELRNLSSPRTHIIPLLIETIQADEADLTLLTGAGRVYPFLRTHALLEEPALSQLGHPVVLLFPGEYIQEEGGGSHLRLFGRVPSPTITNPHYRAINLDHYRI